MQHFPGSEVVYFWRKRKDKCPARALLLGRYDITDIGVICKGPAISEHLHTPDIEEVTAMKLVGTQKKERYRISCSFTHLNSTYCSKCFLQCLPDKDNLCKAVQHLCTKGIPTNPRNNENSPEIAEIYCVTRVGEFFFIRFVRRC